MKNIIIGLVSLLFCLTLQSQSYEIVLATDFDGNVTAGSKEALIKEIRMGQPVRIGWQLDFDEDKEANFDHWAEAEFITILGSEVFTQIRNINAQIPNTEIPQIEIIPNNLMWTAILGTNGKLVNRFVMKDLEIGYDDEGNALMTDEEIEQEMGRRTPQTWAVATFWAVPR